MAYRELGLKIASKPKTLINAAYTGKIAIKLVTRERTANGGVG